MEDKKIKSPILKHARQTFVDWINRIDNDECSEGEVSYMMGRLNAESKGYHNDDTYVNYDEAQRILHSSRIRPKRLLASNGIEQQTVSNMKVGFLKSEVVALSWRLENTSTYKRRREYKKSPKDKD